MNQDEGMKTHSFYYRFGYHANFLKEKGILKRLITAQKCEINQVKSCQMLRIDKLTANIFSSPNAIARY